MNDIRISVEECPTLESVLTKRLKLWDSIYSFANRFAMFTGGRERWTKIETIEEVKPIPDKYEDESGETFDDVEIFYKDQDGLKTNNPAVRILTISGFKRHGVWRLWEQERHIYKHDADVAREVFG